MDAAEEEQDALAAQLGEAAQKQLALQLGIVGRLRGAVAHHALIGPVEPETLTGQPILLGGEQHSPCIAQHLVIGPGPIGPLLEVLERIGALEPRIKHAVGVDEIGNDGAAQGAPRGKGVVLPGALNGHDIVVLNQKADAGGKAAAVAVAGGHWAQADGLKQLVLQPGGIGTVEAGYGGGHGQRIQGRWVIWRTPSIGRPPHGLSERMRRRSSKRKSHYHLMAATAAEPERICMTVLAQRTGEN